MACTCTEHISKLIDQLRFDINSPTASCNLAWYASVKYYNARTIAKLGGVDLLIRELNSGDGVRALHAAEGLGVIAGYIALGEEMLRAGAIGPLLNWFQSDDRQCQQVSLWALSRLIHRDSDITVDSGILQALIANVDRGQADEPKHAAQVLRNLARKYAVQIVDAGGIQPLIKLVRNGTDLETEHAAVTLRFLAQRGYSTTLAANGAIRALVKRIGSDDRVTTEQILITLQVLATESSEKAENL